nr:MAG TPA: hypothetical protein [Caudoviricetes sp.]
MKINKCYIYRTSIGHLEQRLTEVVGLYSSSLSDKYAIIKT